MVIIHTSEMCLIGLTAIISIHIYESQLNNITFPTTDNILIVNNISSHE